MTKLPEKFGLYPVITEKFCINHDSINVLNQVCETNIEVVQFREKDISDRELYFKAEQFRDITSKYNKLLIIDDRIDIAVGIGADGVHLGQDDYPYWKVKDKFPELIVGVSTHNEEEILNAINCDVDYINIGPIFPTNTKNSFYKPVGINNLKKYIDIIKNKNKNIILTSMGGIKINNIEQVLNCGIRNIAMVTEITMSNNIKQTVTALLSIINKYN